jgi:hypothetical protein
MHFVCMQLDNWHRRGRCGINQAPLGVTAQVCATSPAQTATGCSEWPQLPRSSHDDLTTAKEQQALLLPHLAVPSALALTKLLPVVLKATSRTSSVWPVLTDRQRPLRTSHSRADVSMDPLRTMLPAGHAQTNTVSCGDTALHQRRVHATEKAHTTS